MTDFPPSKFEIEILRMFQKEAEFEERSPKEVDAQLNLGNEKIIGLFLDLEVEGFIEWVYLNLVEIDLERSTKEIYDQVYNSSARLTNQGQLFLKSLKPSKDIA